MIRWICIHVSVCVLLQAAASPPLVHFCNSSDQCAEDECCVSMYQPDGRRFALSAGTCQKRGTDGSKCYVNEVSPGAAGLYYNCPCTSGYSCKGTGMREIPQGEIGMCTSSPLTKATVNQPCASGADCADTQCCLSYVRPVGKRQLQGHCSPMGTDGSRCLVRMGSGKPNDTVFECPCISGLTCHGNGFFDVPLGEMGTCSSSITKKATLNKPCNSGADCSDTECCVNNMQLDGKRQVRGHCSAMGTDGSHCLVRMGSGKPSGTVYECPCISGLTCRGNGMFDIPLGETGTCVSTHVRKSTLNKPCTSGADCSDTECCFTESMMGGKRQLHGHCSPMGTVGSHCYVRMSSGKPNGTVYGCPCISGLTCHGNGMYDMPFGETGQCGA